MDRLIALDLNRAAQAASRQTTVLLDAALALVRDLLEVDEDPRRRVLAQRFEACRAAMADGASPEDLTELCEGCLADGRDIVAEIRAQQFERTQEMKSLVSVVREVVATMGGEMTSLHTSLQRSTDRFDAISQMTDPTQIKARLVAEVMTLKQLTLRRQRVWDETARELETRITTLEHQLIATQSEASTDPLTGIANRRVFEQTAKEWARTPSVSFVLGILDVDDFKLINDTRGHAAGDLVLTYVARTLSQSFRSDDVVARIGGDEFGVLARGLTLTQAERRLRQIMERFSQPPSTDGAPAPVTSLSCGLVEHSAGDTFATLFERADAALYAAKDQGKNRLVTRPVPFIRDLLSR